MKRRIKRFSLAKAAIVKRAAKELIQPPALVDAKNVYVERSDSALTVRKPLVASDWTPASWGDDWDNTSANGEWLQGAYSVIQNGATIGISNFRPIGRSANGTETICETYTDGTVSTSGNKATGANTAWNAEAWPGCWMMIGTTLYLVREVNGDDELILDPAPASDVSNSSYTIYKTHSKSNCLTPQRLHQFGDTLMYSAVKPYQMLPKHFSGPFAKDLTDEAEDESFWTKRISLSGTNSADPGHPVGMSRRNEICFSGPYRYAYSGSEWVQYASSNGVGPGCGSSATTFPASGIAGITATGYRELNDLPGVSKVYLSSRGWVKTAESSTWTERDTGIDARLRSAAGSDSILLVVGEWTGSDAAAATSTRATPSSWTTRAPGFATTTNFIDVVWSQSLGKFIAVTDTGHVVTTADGSSWTDTGDKFSSEAAKFIITDKAGGLFVVGTDTKLWISGDGATWTEITLSAGNVPEAGCWDTSFEKFYVTLWNETTMYFYVEEVVPDTATSFGAKTEITGSFSSTSVIKSAVDNGSVEIYVCEDGVYTSTAWAKVLSPPSGETFTDIAFNGSSTCVVVGTSQTVYYTTDPNAATWYATSFENSTPITILGDYDCYQVSWRSTNASFVVTCHNEPLQVSADGITWAQGDYPIQGDMSRDGICIGNYVWNGSHYVSAAPTYSIVGSTGRAKAADPFGDGKDYYLTQPSGASESAGLTRQTDTITFSTTDVHCMIFGSPTKHYMTRNASMNWTGGDEFDHGGVPTGYAIYDNGSNIILVFSQNGRVYTSTLAATNTYSGTLSMHSSGVASSIGPTVRSLGYEMDSPLDNPIGTGLSSGYILFGMSDGTINVVPKTEETPTTTIDLGVNCPVVGISCLTDSSNVTRWCAVLYNGTTAYYATINESDWTFSLNTVASGNYFNNVIRDVYDAGTATGDGDFFLIGEVGSTRVLAYDATTGWGETAVTVHDTGSCTELFDGCRSAYDNSIVFVGDDGYIGKMSASGRASGIVQKTSGTSNTLYSIDGGFGDGLVAVGDRVILYSKDKGETWTEASDYDDSKVYRAVIRRTSSSSGNGDYIAVSEDGDVYSSYVSGAPGGGDGSVWTRYDGWNGCYDIAEENETPSYSTWLRYLGVPIGAREYYISEKSGPGIGGTGVEFDQFVAISDIYRSNSMVVAQGQVLMAPTYEYDSDDDTWTYYPRRIRRTAFGTYNVFVNDAVTYLGAGFTDLPGTGEIWDLVLLGSNVAIFESDRISAFMPTGNVTVPWSYRSIAEGLWPKSNVVVVNNTAYFVAEDGLLYQVTGGLAVSAVQSSFDFTVFSDHESASDPCLSWSPDTQTLIIYAEGGTEAHFVGPTDGSYTRVEIPSFSISGTHYEMKSIISLRSSSGTTIYVNYAPDDNTGNEDMIISELSLTGYVARDDVPSAGVTSYWDSQIITGRTRLSAPKSETQVSEVVVRSYAEGEHRPYVGVQIKTTEDENWHSVQSYGTTIVGASGVVGTHTAYSHIVAGPSSTSTSFLLPCPARKARLYLDDAGTKTLLSDWTHDGKYTVTLASAKPSGQTLYAYWGGEPQVCGGVGYLVEASDGMHVVTSVTDFKTMEVDWNADSDLDGTVIPAMEMPSGDGEMVFGLPRECDDIEVRVIVVPQLASASTTTIAKIREIDIAYNATGEERMDDIENSEE